MEDDGSHHGVQRAGILPPLLLQYQRGRRIFACRTYTLAFIWVIISVIQWLCFTIIDELTKLFGTHFIIALVFLNLALVLVSVFIFYDRIRFLFPLNWIVTICIVESITLGLVFVFAYVHETLTFAISAASAFGLVILCALVGVTAPHDFTLDVVIIFMVSILLFIASVFYALFHVLTSIGGAIYVYCGCVLVSVILFTVYHTQTINGGRYAEMRTVDFLLASLIIYHDFVVLLIVLYFIVHAICGGKNEPAKSSPPDG